MKPKPTPRMRLRELILALPLLVGCALAAANPSILRTADVQRFFDVLDKAGGMPDEAMLASEYFALGSEGLREFSMARRITPASIAKKVAQDPGLYQRARECAASLPKVQLRVEAAVAKLKALYPSAKIIPLTVVVGHGRPVAIGGPRGAIVGLEALCDWHVPNPNIEDRLVHVIAHEYVHVQQTKAADDPTQASMLLASLVEGGAEFVSELISGSVAYRHLANWAQGRENDIESEFLKDIDQPAVRSRWVYNGLGTSEAPGDLGYWVGYRITKAYYKNASDKAQALRNIIELADPKQFLEDSLWRPGMPLQ